MRKCKSCGTEYEKKHNLCPKCGIAPGPQALTDLQPADLKAAGARRREEAKEARERRANVEEASCRSCGAPVGKSDEWCPDCGKGGGPQTITDLPSVHLREAHRKLKEEIREAKEKRD